MSIIKVEYSGMNLDLNNRTAIQHQNKNDWWFLDPNTHAEMVFTPNVFCLIAPKGDGKNCLRPTKLEQRASIILSPIDNKRLTQQWRFVDVAEYHRGRVEGIPDDCEDWYYIINREGRKGTRPHWSMGVKDELTEAGTPVVLWQVKKPNVRCPGNHWWNPDPEAR